MPRDILPSKPTGQSEPSNVTHDETPAILVHSPEQQAQLRDTMLEHSISPPETEKQSSRQSMSSLERTEAPASSRFITQSDKTSDPYDGGEAGEGRSLEDGVEDVEWEDEDTEDIYGGDNQFEDNDAHFDNAAAAAAFMMGGGGGGRGQRRGGGFMRLSRGLRAGGATLGQLLMGAGADDEEDEEERAGGARAVERTPRDELYPYVQTLSVRDVDACVALEEACWKEADREGRAAITYRLTTCPELSLGIYSSSSPAPPPSSNIPSQSELPTYAHSSPVETSQPSRKAVLVAMVLASKTSSPVATDDAMAVPSDWRSKISLPSNKETQDGKGHLEEGRTICLWHLGVLPQLQHRGLGTTLLRSYQQRMSSSGVADRMALLAREDIISLYEGVGFENRGKSESNFAGGGWTDLVYEFPELTPG